MTQLQRVARARGFFVGTLIAVATLVILFASVSLSRAQSVYGTAATTSGSITAPATSVSATSTGAMPVVLAPPENAPAPMLAQVDGDGNALIRGVVQSVGSDLITVGSWGGTWIVRTTADTSVTPVGAQGAGDVSGIMPGDFVGAAGVIATDQDWTVNAAVVRDWTQTAAITADASAAGSDSTGALGSTTPAVTDEGSGSISAGLPAGDALYTGTATGIQPDGSFTLTDASGNAYTVTPTAGATLWDDNRDVVPASTFEENDSVRVDGALSGTSIAADVIRDISR